MAGSTFGDDVLGILDHGILKLYEFTSFIWLPNSPIFFLFITRNAIYLFREINCCSENVTAYFLGFDNSLEIKMNLVSAPHFELLLSDGLVLGCWHTKEFHTSSEWLKEFPQHLLILKQQN